MEIDVLTFFLKIDIGEDIIVTLTSGTMPWSLTYRQDNSIRTIRDIRESNVRIPTDTGNLRLRFWE